MNTKRRESTPTLCQYVYTAMPPILGEGRKGRRPREILIAKCDIHPTFSHPWLVAFDFLYILKDKVICICVIYESFKDKRKKMVGLKNRCVSSAVNTLSKLLFAKISGDTKHQESTHNDFYHDGRSHQRHHFINESAW